MDDVWPKAVELIGRSSSHFTRVATFFAHALDVPFDFIPVHDVTRLDASGYWGNPALKIPTLRVGGAPVFGTENICRRLAELSPTPLRIVWPEQLTPDVARNAQELVWHCMAAQVQLVFGTAIAKLPADNVYFTKGKVGFTGALTWLEEHFASVLQLLPAPRDLSLFEVTLFCLLEHVAFRSTLQLAPWPSLTRWSADFSRRPAAQRTRYRFDPPVG